MDEQMMDRIQRFLLERGQDVSTISKGRLKQLVLADEAIQKHIEAVNCAQQEIGRHRFNISTIATETGIARKTFYNNELLKEYVERYCRNDKTVDEDRYLRLKEKCDQQERQLHQMIMRDIDAENLRIENTNLCKEIQLLQTRNANLEEELERRLQELAILEKQIKPRVIEFKAN